MKVNETVINQLRNSNKAKAALMHRLDISAQTIERWYKENETDGDLTKATAVRLLSQELGIPEAEILTEA